MNKDKIVICNECGSSFIQSKSKMKALCPECSAILYGYEICEHFFENGKCVKCGWDGSRSEYIKSILNKF